MACARRCGWDGSPGPVVGVDVPHHHLGATPDDHAIQRPGVAGPHGPTPAPRFELPFLAVIGPLQQALRPGKQPGHEVAEQAERAHVDVQVVRDACQLLHLGRRVELGLVTDEHVDAAADPGRVNHDPAPVRVVLHGDRRLLQPDAAGEHRPARSKRLNSSTCLPARMAL